MLSYEGPLLRSVLFNEFDQEDILVLSPGLFLPCFTIINTFDRIGVIGVDLLPASDAIDVLPARKVAGDVLPVHLL